MLKTEGTRKCPTMTSTIRQGATTARVDRSPRAKLPLSRPRPGQADRNRVSEGARQRARDHRGTGDGRRWGVMMATPC